MTPNKPYRLITFDVYTALFDIESSLTPMVSNIPNVPDPLSFIFICAWRRKQLEYALISNSLGGKRISFEILTRRKLDDTLTCSKLDLLESARMHLSHIWLELQPWGEAPSVLDSPKARGCTMALLSNGDTAMLQTLTKKLPPVFEQIFSSEQAGYYKPHPSVYNLPLQFLQLKANEVLHVAGSATDALGTKAAGLHCAWNNRGHDPHLDPNLPVDHEMPNLSQLLEIL